MKSILIICLSSFSIAEFVIPVHARLALDGAAHQEFLATSASLTLTTSHPRDIVIVGIILIHGTNVTVTSIADGEGLTYTQRTRFSGPPDCLGVAIEEWYTFAPTALSTDIITVTLSSVPLGFAGFIAWGVSGSAVSMFDGSASFPATSAKVTPPGIDCPSSVSTVFSTQSRHDFIFGLIAINDGNAVPSQGFTGLCDCSGGSFFGSMDMMYQVATGGRLVSSASASGDAVAMVVDAIQLAGPF